MKLKKGDTVVVIAGKDKGQEGEVVQVLPTANKVIVNGVNTAGVSLTQRDGFRDPSATNDPRIGQLALKFLF